MMKVKKKKIAALLLSAIMAIGLMTSAVQAEETAADTWDGTADVSWYDPQGTEFHIETAEKFAGLAELVNSGTTFEGQTIYLENDVDLAGHVWISIGTGNNVSNYFGGTFDGQGHSILNYKGGGSATGVFGVVHGGILKNTGVENGTILLSEDDGNIRAGLLADWVLRTEVTNCFTTGSITTNTKNGCHTGGLIGQAMAGSQIVGCYSSAVIESKAVTHADAIGGIIGSWETAGDSPLISDCYFDGEIIFNGGGDNMTGLSTNVAGILGMCFSDEPNLVIKNCVVYTNNIISPGDIDIVNGNGGMWISWFEDAGKPTNCFWPDDGREWPAAIAFGTYISTNMEEGLYFEESGSAVTDFNDPSILSSLQANAEDGVVWTSGITHPTFGWDEKNIAADYSAIDSAMTKVPQDLNLYTDETVANLNNALGNVVEGLSLEDQEQVNAMAQAIEAAVAALEYKDADYSAVDAAVAKAEALVKENYKDFSAVEAAVAAVDYSRDITGQEAVNAMAQAIEDAIAALEYKDADYSAVDAAIAKADALNKEDYKDFSAVEAAIAAVDRTKNITEQEAVNAMAKAIEDALANLEEKPAEPDDPVVDEPDTDKPDKDNQSTDNSGAGDDKTDADKPSDENGKGNTVSPETGDRSIVFVWAAILLTAGAAGVYTGIVYKKIKDKKVR